MTHNYTMKTTKNTQLNKYGLFFYPVKNDLRFCFPKTNVSSKQSLQTLLCKGYFSNPSPLGQHSVPLTSVSMDYRLRFCKSFPFGSARRAFGTTFGGHLIGFASDFSNTYLSPLRAASQTGPEGIPSKGVQDGTEKNSVNPIASPDHLLCKWYQGSFKSVAYDPPAGEPSPLLEGEISKMTTEKLLDAVFYYQELVVEWVKRISPRPSPLTLACGAGLYFVAICTTIQRQEGDRWFSVFIDSKVPGLSEPSQKSLWDSFENVTSQYVTLNQNQSVVATGEPLPFGEGGVSGETQSLCDSSIVSRVDLYKKRVLIRLQSPWDKQSRQQYAGLFYDQNKLADFSKGNGGEVSTDSSSLRQSPHDIPPQPEMLGIQPWYKIDARKDYNPILFPKAATSESAPPSVIARGSGLSNTLEKTKNWFPVTNKISLWDYFPFQRSKEQVYFGSDTIPSKLDSAFLLSSFPRSYSLSPASLAPRIVDLDTASEKSAGGKVQLQKLPLIQEGKIGFTCCKFVELNPPPLGQHSVPSTRVVGSSNSSYKAKMGGKNLVQAMIPEKPSFAQQVWDPQKLKVWFEDTKELAHGEEFHAFENKIKTLFYSQGILPLPEFDDVDEVFEENEETPDTSGSGGLREDKDSSDSKFFPVVENTSHAHNPEKEEPILLSPYHLQSEQKDKANFGEYQRIEEESPLYEDSTSKKPKASDLASPSLSTPSPPPLVEGQHSVPSVVSSDISSPSTSVLDLSNQSTHVSSPSVIARGEHQPPFAYGDAGGDGGLVDFSNPSPFPLGQHFVQSTNVSPPLVDFSNPSPSGQHSVPLFSSPFYKNTWISPRFMSGYKFPELTKKEIFYLHRRFAIRDLLPSLPSPLVIASGASPSSFKFKHKGYDPWVSRGEPSPKAQTKWRIEVRSGLPFPVFNHQKLASKISLLPIEINLPPALPASLFRDMFSPSFFSPFLDQQGVSSELYKSSKDTLSQDHGKLPELKLRYRVICLEEEKEVEKAFARLGRDYKDYLSYPKDGLEALKVSPSLEDEEKQADTLAEAKEKDRPSELGKTLKKFAYKNKYAVKKEKETSDLPDVNNTDLTPWISSLWGTENMLSDRKSSFLGKQDVLRKRLMSREAQDIAAEIFSRTNPPLPKLRTRARRHELHLTAPKKFEAKNDVGSQHRTVQVNSRLRKKLRKKPVISTHLATPFETHHIMPEISKNEWRQMIEYQLRQYFFEEDKRLEPLVKKNPHHHFKIQRVNTFLPWVRIRTPKEKSVEWPLTRLDYEQIKSPKRGFLFEKYSTPNLNVSAKTTKFQTPPQDFTENVISKQKVTLSSRQAKANSDFLSWSEKPGLSGSMLTQGKHMTRHEVLTQRGRGQQNWVPSRLREWSNYALEQISQVKILGDTGKKILSQQLTFEPLTKHSWLLIYRLFLAFALRDIGKYLYRVTLKDFMIRMAHTHFGLAVTSEEFRQSLQHVPPKLFYRPTKRLQDAAGLQEIIPVVSEIIWFLRNSARGKGVPKGVLLVGPPGTGKTFLVQAIAGEAQVPVVVQSMSALSSSHLQERPYDRLQEMFQVARKQAPCILFMDEIDAVAETRGDVVTNDIGAPDALFSLEGDFAGHTSYSLQTDLLPTSDTSWDTTELTDVSVYQDKKETEVRRVNLLLRLLTEIDGPRSLNGVVLIATTNRPAVLDPALLRPGRFEKMIYLTLPNHQKRIDLFKLHTKKIGSVKRMPWDYLASRTADMSGADIAGAINHSAIRAILDDTVHTVETLEQGLNYVTGAPGVSQSVPFTFGDRQRRTPTTSGGPMEAFSKIKRPFKKVADTGYTVYGGFDGDGYTDELYPQKVSLNLNKKTFSKRIKQGANTSRLAYYQAGKGVVQTVLPRHPAVGFLAFSPETNNLSPFIKTSWQKLISPQANHRRVDLETTLIGMYAGKAAEMLHLSVNSFKNDFSSHTAVSERTWLSQSNLGLPELLIASSLAHIMIDRWYLYSKRMFSLKLNKIMTSLNEEDILDDDLFPMFRKLCEEMDRDRAKPKSSFSEKKSDAAKEMDLYLEEKESGFRPVFEGIEQERQISAWWQDKLYNDIEQLGRKPHGKWYRMYVLKPEEKERNEEWLAPDFYYHQDSHLPDMSQHKSRDKDITKLRSKAAHKFFKQGLEKAPLQSKVCKLRLLETRVEVKTDFSGHSHKDEGELASSQRTPEVGQDRKEKKTLLYLKKKTRGTGTQIKEFSFLPKTSQIKIKSKRKRKSVFAKLKDFFKPKMFAPPRDEPSLWRTQKVIDTPSPLAITEGEEATANTKGGGEGEPKARSADPKGKDFKTRIPELKDVMKSFGPPSRLPWRTPRVEAFGDAKDLVSEVLGSRSVEPPSPPPSVEGEEEPVDVTFEVVDSTPKVEPPPSGEGEVEPMDVTSEVFAPPTTSGGPVEPLSAEPPSVESPSVEPPSPPPSVEGEGEPKARSADPKGKDLKKRRRKSKESGFSLTAIKTWNGVYWLERDYSYHCLVTACFYTAFLLLDENRELLDFLADHLMRFQKLRKHEILRICSLFQLEMSGEYNYTVDTENDKQTCQDNTSTDAKTVTLSESSAPLAPSWWEKKGFKEALLSSEMGFTETSSVNEGVAQPSPPPSPSPSVIAPPEVIASTKVGGEGQVEGEGDAIIKGDEAITEGGSEPIPPSEPTDFGQGVKPRKKKLKDDSDFSIMTHEAKDTVKRKLEEAEDRSPFASTLTVEEAEEVVELKLQKGEETPELKLQENQTEQFAKPTKEKPGLPTKGESNEFDEPQEESTALIPIWPPSSQNTETADAQEKHKKPPKDKFWILEKGWGRYSRYKKPNFMRFDFIKFY
uniref:Cell division protein n=1 Tax=Watanabea reniformis TaxID=191674 RepID=A0A097KK54_9CHLO|nr:cell division protein [Watanabea reniformis]AIT93563.1 cell division protein [Watanabea reniformis]